VFLIIAGRIAHRKAVAHFDLQCPRFRKLVLRMTSPLFDTEHVKELPPVLAQVKGRSKTHMYPGHQSWKKASELPGNQLENTLVLATPSVYSENIIDQMKNRIGKDLGLFVIGVLPIFFDLNDDRENLKTVMNDKAIHVVVLQEVWQPPIRESLQYLNKIKTQFLMEKNLWVYLTQNPMEEVLFVDASDMNYKGMEKSNIITLKYGYRRAKV
jgi:hypothetical protein